MEIALHRKLSFIIGDNELNHEKSVEITETSESDPEESKKTEKAVDPQSDQFQAEAENNTSQTAFHILGGFKEKTVQKVALIKKSSEWNCIEGNVFVKNCFCAIAGQKSIASVVGTAWRHSEGHEE